MAVASRTALSQGSGYCVLQAVFFRFRAKSSTSQRICALIIPMGRSCRREDRTILPAHFSLMQKCFLTGASICHVPEKPASTTKPSPGCRVTGVPPSGVIVIWPSIRWTNS